MAASWQDSRGGPPETILQPVHLSDSCMSEVLCRGWAAAEVDAQVTMQLGAGVQGQHPKEWEAQYTCVITDNVTRRLSRKQRTGAEHLYAHFGTGYLAMWLSDSERWHAKALSSVFLISTSYLVTCNSSPDKSNAMSMADIKAAVEAQTGRPLHSFRS